MSRQTEEWIGATDDSRPPPRVFLRIFLKHDGRCACGCNRKIAPGEHWQLDHIVALINGGENRETNLQPLLTEHHANKTKADVAQKSQTYRKRLSHHGIRAKSSRPMPGSRASGWKRKLDGTVERRE